MSTPNGYNNLGYCHQYDSSFYDYQYVPEIDPDSFDFEESKKTEQSKFSQPNFGNNKIDFSESDEFEGSDQSNRSIIIEECNNRRVTLICEKRSKVEDSRDDFYEDNNLRTAYYQDISLESENGYDNKSLSNYDGKERSLRHRKPLEPPVDKNVRIYSRENDNDRRYDPTYNCNQPTTSTRNYNRYQKYHRYEEIPSDEDCPPIKAPAPTSVHRYAEISSDENGFPTLKKEIQIEKNNDTYSFKSHQNNYHPTISRAISPIHYSDNFSPPLSPNKIYQRNSYMKEFVHNSTNLNSPGFFTNSSSPLKSNFYEMSELSPPRSSENTKNDQTLFIHSPKRQPPIGASTIIESREPYSINEKCVLPKNLIQINPNSSRSRSRSFPNSPRKKDFVEIQIPTSKPYLDKKITHIFHLKPIKTSQNKAKLKGKLSSEIENNSARRNISNSFTDPPRESLPSPKLMPRSPYKSTTIEVNPTKTAVITPIFQRKNKQEDLNFSPKRSFAQISQTFQSTGNLLKSTKEPFYASGVDYQFKNCTTSPVKIKRNQSVPNFTQSLAVESRMKNQEIIMQRNRKITPNPDFQSSPKKELELISSIGKSRISLIDPRRSSWSYSDSYYQPQCSICFIFATIIHLLTTTATCAISFYLLSKIGRRYYLDFGILAGFVNFILGLLGFRSYCWRWLPNRNYVSGFIALAALSVITCAGLTYLIIARPMAGDPMVDIMGGAICAVSVLMIVLALTGLTMSGCCKAPPPDNRVTDI